MASDLEIIIPLVNLTLILGGIFFAFLGLRSFFVESVTILRKILETTVEFWKMVDSHTQTIAELSATEKDIVREVERTRDRLDRLIDRPFIDKS
jgi:hypothetical protein